MKGKSNLQNMTSSKEFQNLNERSLALQQIDNKENNVLNERKK